MYPTAIVGILLVASATKYAVVPERRRFVFVVWMHVLTLLVGTLGFVTGFIKTTLAASDAAEPGNTVIQGIGESANNIGLALCLCVMAGIATAIGLSRTKKGNDASLIDPHT